MDRVGRPGLPGEHVGDRRRRRRRARRSSRRGCPAGRGRRTAPRCPRGGTRRPSVRDGGGLARAALLGEDGDGRRHGQRRSSQRRPRPGAIEAAPARTLRRLASPSQRPSSERRANLDRYRRPLRAPPGACTTRPTSTTPAASPSSRACARRPRTRSSSGRCSRSTSMEHRGAEGADPDTGDGAGILIQIPDALPARGGRLRAARGAAATASAMCFLPQEAARRGAGRGADRAQRRATRASACSAGARCPSIPTHCGTMAPALGAPHRPAVRRRGRRRGRPGRARAQALRDPPAWSSRAQSRASRSRASPRARSSTRGCSTRRSCSVYFPDLRDERLASRLALVHSRFSTNTFPSWELAHPYRMLAHNGEINTLRGNRNWMRAREHQLASPLFGDDLAKIRAAPARRHLGLGLARRGCSSCSCSAAARPPHAISMLIPEAYQGRAELPPGRKRLLRLPRAADGAVGRPGGRGFTDGRVIGATLDRNGLRPGRWLETHDGWVVFASETGVLGSRRGGHQAQGRLQPGQAASSSTSKPSGSSRDEEIKRELAAPAPVRRVAARPRRPDRGPARPQPACAARRAPARRASSPSAGREEDLRVLLAPMAARRRRAHRLDGQRHGARRALRRSARRCSPTSSSCSPR